MKILFDNQIFEKQKYGGISRYFSEILKYISSTDDFEYELPIRDTNNEYLKKIKPFSEKDLSRKVLIKKPNSKIKHLLNNLKDFFDRNSNLNKNIKAIEKQDFDIFHPTYYSTYFLKYLKNKPFVLTVHDMINEIYPEHFSFLNQLMIRNKKKLILKANKIIAVSENTKKDIIKLYDINEEKIKVIYHGNSLESVKEIPSGAPEIPEKYILFVGARDSYKNFKFFIESINPIIKEDKNLHVIVTGSYSKKNSFSKEEIALFSRLNIEKQILQYSVNDEMLAYLYRNAICFVYPTLYEGFGIPVLEAFACSCPAVISNTSSLPEVGGDAVIYFDPTDNNDIMQSVKKVVEDKSLRDEMILKGKEQLKKFSWIKTAEETMSVYANTK